MKDDPENWAPLRRELLDERTRAVSDTLDEYLSRIHGIFAGWAHPAEFIYWLEERGYTVVKMEAQDADPTR